MKKYYIAYHIEGYMSPNNITLFLDKKNTISGLLTEYSLHKIIDEINKIKGTNCTYNQVTILNMIELI